MSAKPKGGPDECVHLTAAELIAMAGEWHGDVANRKIQRLVAEVFRLRAKVRALTAATKPQRVHP